MRMKFVVAVAVACLMLSQVNAQQFHPAEEIIAGNFSGDYDDHYTFPGRIIWNYDDQTIAAYLDADADNTGDAYIIYRNPANEFRIFTRNAADTENWPRLGISSGVNTATVSIRNSRLNIHSPVAGEAALIVRDVGDTTDRAWITEAGSFVSKRSSAGAVVEGSVGGDSFARLSLETDRIQWGSGSVIPDTNLYRSAANTLKTDDNFEVAGIATVTDEIRITNPGGMGDASYTWGGDEDTGLYHPSANEIRITTGGNDRVTIDSSGNVGIGVSPSYKLDVNGDVRSSTYYDRDDTSYYANPAGTSQMNIIDFGEGIIDDDGTYFKVGHGNRHVYIRSLNGNVYAYAGSGDTVYLGLSSGNTITTRDNPLYAPIMYDYDNTGYYANPAETSEFNQINAATICLDTCESTWPTGGAGGADADWVTDGSWLWNNTATRVGIGTTSPDTLLDVESSGTPVLTVQTSAQSSQDAIVRIRGARTTSASADVAQLEFYNDESGGAFQMAEISTRNADGTSGTSDSDLLFKVNDGSSLIEAMRIDHLGRIGIGTASPLELLDVNGAIRLGTTSNTNTGTIRWTGTDFEGRTIAGWVSLTAGGAGLWSQSGSDIYYNAGNVGIGSEPSTKLTVNETTNNIAVIAIDSGSTISRTSAVDFYDRGTNKWGIGKDAGNEFYIAEFGVANRLKIEPGTGEIGIGTDNPGAQLSLKYSTGTDQGQIYMDSGDDFHIRNNQQNNEIVVYDGTGGLGFWYNGVERMEIDSTGGVEVKGDIYADSGSLINSNNWPASENPWDPGIYSNNGNWMRFTTNAAPFKWFSDGGTGTNSIMELNSNGNLNVGGKITQIQGRGSKLGQLQHARSISFTTSAMTCLLFPIQIDWDTPFADTSYTVSTDFQLTGGTQGCTELDLWERATNYITVHVCNLCSSGSSTGFIHAIAIHD